MKPKRPRPPGVSRGARPPAWQPKQPADEFSLMSNRELLECLKVSVEPERREALLRAAIARGLSVPKEA